MFLLFRYSIVRQKYVTDRRISISGLIFNLTQSAIAVQYLSHRTHPLDTLPLLQKYQQKLSAAGTLLAATFSSVVIYATTNIQNLC